MRSTATSTARLEARISKELHATLKRAAELQNRTVTDFVITAVQEAVQNTIEQTEVLRLSLADQERFAQAATITPQGHTCFKARFCSSPQANSASIPDVLSCLKPYIVQGILDQRERAYRNLRL